MSFNLLQLSNNSDISGIKFTEDNNGNLLLIPNSRAVYFKNYNSNNALYITDSQGNFRTPNDFACNSNNICILHSNNNIFKFNLIDNTFTTILGSSTSYIDIKNNYINATLGTSSDSFKRSLFTLYFNNNNNCICLGGSTRKGIFLLRNLNAIPIIYYFSTVNVITSFCLDNNDNIILSTANSIYYSSVLDISNNLLYKSNIITNKITQFSMDDQNNCLGASTDGIYFSKNSGINWTIKQDVSCNSVHIDNSGNCLAGCKTGLYYGNINNGNIMWNISKLNSNSSNINDNITSVFGAGNNCIAYSSSYLYTSINNGISYTQYNKPGIQAIYINKTGNVFYSTSTQVNYLTPPLCYNKDTRILCLMDGIEQYIRIDKIEQDTLIKTYKEGYKKVKYISNFNYLCLNKSDKLNRLYKMKENDLIVTGYHSILVDKLTNIEKQKNLEFNFKSSIYDKKLLFACNSDYFEVVEDDKEYQLYHLVLEHDDDILKQYGIYVNEGILSETCCEKTFMKRLKTNN
jgi:hypothetical protein